MRTYLSLLSDLISYGVSREDRTGVGTLSIFGYQMRFDLTQGFPLLTTKKMHVPSIVYELLWFLKGHTHVKFLCDHGVSIWDEWATKEECAKFGRPEGELGPIYGHQWRNFDGDFDQIAYVIDQIKTNPTSRRLIVTSYHPKEATLVTLPPCHTLFQFYVHENQLSCHLYQRSADAFLGVPFNIASYALLLSMIAHVTHLIPKELVHSFGDVHLYKNHIEQAKLQLERETYPSPSLVLDPDIRAIDQFEYGHIKIERYRYHPKISAKVAI